MNGNQNDFSGRNSVPMGLTKEQLDQISPDGHELYYKRLAVEGYISVDEFRDVAADTSNTDDQVMEAFQNITLKYGLCDRWLPPEDQETRKVWATLSEYREELCKKLLYCFAGGVC
jgi:hypothetical protein